jgi:hypothetical protein
MMRSGIAAPTDNTPPGRPFPPELKSEIRRLARELREGDLRAEEESRARTQPRPIQRFIRAGAVLIALQTALLAYLYLRQNAAAKTQASAPAPPTTCQAAVNRAYWKVVAYVSDHGRPPAKLEELVGSYVERLPFDPVTRAPLAYWTDGNQFSIRCSDSAPQSAGTTGR